MIYRSILPSLLGCALLAACQSGTDVQAPSLPSHLAPGEEKYAEVTTFESQEAKIAFDYPKVFGALEKVDAKNYKFSAEDAPRMMFIVEPAISSSALRSRCERDSVHCIIYPMADGKTTMTVRYFDAYPDDQGYLGIRYSFVRANRLVTFEMLTSMAFPWRMGSPKDILSQGRNYEELSLSFRLGEQMMRSLRFVD